MTRKFITTHPFPEVPAPPPGPIPPLSLVSCSAYYSSTLKMETTCSSETSVDFQQTTRRYIPEARTRHFLTCLSLRLIDWLCVLCGADQQGNLTCFGIHREPLSPCPPTLRMCVECGFILPHRGGSASMLCYGNCSCGRV
jgi:hypothetical protein